MNRAVATRKLIRTNLRCAHSLWPNLCSKARMFTLRELTTAFQLSLSNGDLKIMDGYWYITHAGLLRLAHRQRCLGIRTVVDHNLSDPAACRWVFKAVVHTSARSRGFVGYGDADPSNVNSLMHGCELRIAETRAVNRALRKAYGIGLCSVEELGGTAQSSSSPKDAARNPDTGSNGQPRVRDRLSQLMHEHRLDPILVKSYAVEFCGVQSLREVSRQKIEDFIRHLREWADQDRDGLLFSERGSGADRHKQHLPKRLSGHQ